MWYLLVVSEYSITFYLSKHKTVDFNFELQGLKHLPTGMHYRVLQTLVFLKREILGDSLTKVSLFNMNNFSDKGTLTMMHQDKNKTPHCRVWTQTVSERCPSPQIASLPFRLIGVAVASLPLAASVCPDYRRITKKKSSLYFLKAPSSEQSSAS
jgi:hypothetical protein